MSNYLKQLAQIKRPRIDATINASESAWQAKISHIKSKISNPLETNVTLFKALEVNLIPQVHRASNNQNLENNAIDS